MRCVLLAAVFLVLIALAACHGDSDSKPGAASTTDWNNIAAQIVDAVPELPPVQGPVYIMLRQGGVARADGWYEAPTWDEALRQGFAATFEACSRWYRDDIDGVEIDLTYDYRAADPKKERPVFTNIHRGVRGIELTVPGHTERFAPTYMLATNRDFDKVIERFGHPDARARLFEAHQFCLVRDEGAWQMYPMFRGNTLVSMNDVTHESTAALARTMADWLIHNVHDDGRMMYKYWPSSGEESSANNMIRQFMATVCMGRLAVFYDDDAIRAVQGRNLVYNFEHYYREDGDAGYIIYGGKAKLGAAALAALALVEHPNADQFADQRTKLVALTRGLQQADGSFNTFYLPPNRTDNQNFYPGETLLLWARLLTQEDDPALYDDFMKSFAYYRDWHRANRNPAFIPWHTQAYYLVWQLKKDPKLANFIFEMNDWLLGMQEWERAVYPDTKGRFYDGRRSYYGPPHASSTGVYLEGLIDAFKLARSTGDMARAERYRVAILRGIRSLMQLQYRDDVDMFYVSERGPVDGGLRTTVYNNEIRVDNIQHGLMALLKILDVFQPGDYDETSMASVASDSKAIDMSR